MEKLKLALATISISIALIFGASALSLGVSHILWNDGICYSCGEAKWEFEGVDRGQSQWYCPNCYTSISIIK